MAKLLFKSQNYIELLLRCVPKTLIEKVETPINVFLKLNWNSNEWQQFFYITANQTFDSATEQWNDEMRLELNTRISEEIRGFV